MTKTRTHRHSALTDSQRRDLGLTPHGVPTERRHYRPDPVSTWRII